MSPTDNADIEGVEKIDGTVEEVKEDSSVSSEEATTSTKIDGTTETEDAKETEDGDSASASADEDISEFIPKKDEEKEEPNQGMQKRIDKLTAKLREAEERLEEMESSKQESKSDKPKYTDDQLKGAIEKAMIDGDHDLMMDVIAYKVNQAKDDLREEYLKEQTQAQRQNEEAQKEWKDVVNLYGHFANAKAEVYPNSSKELNIMDPKSKLRLLAEELWKEPKYHYMGGRKAAITDALALIMQKRTSTSESPQSLKLRKQLEREKMKTAPVSGDYEGGDSEDELEPVMADPNDKLAKYVSERRTSRAKADRGV